MSTARFLHLFRIASVRFSLHHQVWCRGGVQWWLDCSVEQGWNSTWVSFKSRWKDNEPISYCVSQMLQPRPNLCDFRRLKKRFCFSRCCISSRTALIAGCSAPCSPRQDAFQVSIMSFAFPPATIAFENAASSLFLVSFHQNIIVLFLCQTSTSEACKAKWIHTLFEIYWGCYFNKISRKLLFDDWTDVAFLLVERERRLTYDSNATIL